MLHPICGQLLRLALNRFTRQADFMAFAIVIFGAAVRPDGSPSPSLHRRIHYGLSQARHYLEAPVFCSGGRISDGSSEASVMAAILAAHGISPDRLVLDEESRDTLQNVVAAARFILARKLDGALLCTDHYHAPRVRMLFAGLGISSANMPSALGRGEIPWRHLIYMSAREVIAYIYDFLIIRLRGQALREDIATG